MVDLNQVLNDEVSEPASEQATESTETVDTPVEATDSTESEAPETESTGEKESETPAPETTNEAKTWQMTALLDERSKRQELQRQLDALQPREPATAPDVFEDQQGFTSHIQQEIDQRVARAETAFNVKLARIQHDDYDEMAEVFQTLAADNPLLAEQAMRSGNAPDFAYTYAQNHRKAEKFSDPNFLNAEVEKLANQKLEELRKAELTQEIDDASPPSLSTQRAAGGNSSKGYLGPPSLDSVLK